MDLSPVTVGSTRSLDRSEGGTSGQRLFEQIDDQVLQCSVCLESLKEPKVLPCFHTFCRHCLEEIVNSQADKTSLPCPDCRLEVPLPESGVAGLRSNFMVNRLMDVLTQLRIAPDRCGVCDEDEDEEDCQAVAHCADCNMPLCRLHCEAHRRSKKSKKHSMTMFPVPSSPSPKNVGGAPAAVVEHPSERVEVQRLPSVPCAQHSDHAADRFCQNCDKLVCTQCSSDQHHSHR